MNHTNDPGSINPSADPSAHEVEEQVGGGRRLPSPLPILTPTRLRPTVKVTTRDTGLIRDAATRRGRLLDEANPSKADENANEDDPFIATGSPAPPAWHCASLLFPADQPDVCSLFALPKGTVDAPPALVPETSNGTSRPVGSHPSASMSSTTCAPPRPDELPANAVAFTLEPASAGHDDRPKLASVTAPDHGSSEEETPRQAKNATNAADERPELSHTVPVRFETPFYAWDGEEVPHEFIERCETPSPTSQQESEGVLPVLPEATYSEPSGGNLGRPSAAVTEMLESGFASINDQFSQLAGRVGMPFPQVVARFTRRFARLNSTNGWNLYQKYFAANKVQELARLPENKVVEATPSSQMAKCYQLFRSEYTETWNEILTTFEEAESLVDVARTVAHRQQTFAKVVRNMVLAFNSMAKAHSIEGAFLMAGKVVNQDSGLGHVFTTEGAQNFFLDRCRADDNEILAHFKAHVYNKSSLDHVALAFNAAGEQVLGNISKEAEDAEDVVEIADPNEREDHAHVRKAFVAALKKVGCTWASGKLFPWKALPSKLAKSGVVCYNYPDNIPFPGEERQSRAKGGSKGISDLTLSECSSLIAALGDTSKDRLYFKMVPEKKGYLTSARLPVINSAAPAPDSPHSHGKRMYGNLVIDRKGLPRRENIAATRVTKKKKVSRAVEVISIVDSDEIMEVPLEANVKDAAAAPSVHRSKKPKTRGIPEVVITRKKKKKIDSADPRVDGDDQSEADEQPQSRKHRSSREPTFRAAKKRAVAESSKAKGKAKAAQIPIKKQRVLSLPTSSEDEATVATKAVTDMSLLDVASSAVPPSSVPPSKDITRLVVPGEAAARVQVVSQIPSSPKPVASVMPSDAVSFGIHPTTSFAMHTVPGEVASGVVSQVPPSTVGESVSAGCHGGATTVGPIRPKPRVITKDAKPREEDPDVDPFSLRRRVQQPEPGQMGERDTQEACEAVVDASTLALAIPAMTVPARASTGTTASVAKLLAAEEGRVPDASGWSPAAQLDPSMARTGGNATSRTHCADGHPTRQPPGILDPSVVQTVEDVTARGPEMVPSHMSADPMRQPSGIPFGTYDRLPYPPLYQPSRGLPAPQVEMQFAHQEMPFPGSGWYGHPGFNVYPPPFMGPYMHRGAYGDADRARPAPALADAQAHPGGARYEPPYFYGQFGGPPSLGGLLPHLSAAPGPDGGQRNQNQGAAMQGVPDNK
ncbi:hypothetical protein JVT61DRAFT_4495 [Boletus reticuloceps]|uniref:Uncharacterized protein n=1 Tax=Boletus reticuloceps TaxID=495285 RepID=A0A8I3A7B5_9AGAM|nr:hypothetical protein JVT61DRAFT_4495 [Boletus reticuloceps]